jgi:hypothetical protein
MNGFYFLIGVVEFEFVEFFVVAFVVVFVGTVLILTSAGDDLILTIASVLSPSGLYIHSISYLLIGLII